MSDPETGASYHVIQNSTGMMIEPDQPPDGQGPTWTQEPDPQTGELFDVRTEGDSMTFVRSSDVTRETLQQPTDGTAADPARVSQMSDPETGASYHVIQNSTGMMIEPDQPPDGQGPTWTQEPDPQTGELFDVRTEGDSMTFVRSSDVTRETLQRPADGTPGLPAERQGLERRAGEPSIARQADRSPHEAASRPSTDATPAHAERRPGEPPPRTAHEPPIPPVASGNLVTS